MVEEIQGEWIFIIRVENLVTRIAQLYLSLSTLSNSHYKNTLVSYNTRLCVGRNNLSIPIDIPSVSFNHDGSLICALFQRWFPTLYALNDPDPLCVFRTGSHVDFRPPIIPLTSPNAATALSPGGEGGGDTGITYTTAFAASSSSYRAPALFSTNNCISLPSTATQASFTTRLTAFQEHELCFEPNNQFGTGYRTFTTLKSASFCRFSPDTTTSEYFFAGSEDCNIYGWKVPSRREMEEARMLYAPPGGGGGHAGSSIRSTCGDGGGNGLSTSMMDDKGTTAAAAAAVSSSSSSTLSSSSLKSSSPLKKRKIVDEKEGDEKGYDEFRQNHTQSPPPQPPTPLALPPPPPNEAFYVHRPTSLSKQNRQQDDDQSYRVGPLHIDKCDFIIKGRHRSLVNNVLCHPTQPLVYGSGVEKVVLAHSPLPFPETVVGDDPPTVVEFEERPRVYTRQHQINFLLAGHPWGRSDDSSSDEDEEEGNLSDEDVEEGQEDELNEDGEQTAVVTSSPTVHPPPIHQLDLGTTNPHDIQPQQQNEQQSSAYTTSREQRQRLRRRSRTDESLSTLVLFDALVASELNQTARIFPKAYLRSSWLRRYEGGDGGEGRGGRGIGSDESGGQHQAHQQRHHHIQDSSSEDF